MAEETKSDLMLKRTQITIAILAGLATLIVGVWNVKKNVLDESGSGNIEASIRSDRGGSPPALAELFNAQNVLIASGQASGGTYRRDDLPVGNYTLKVSARGHEPQVYTVRVSPKKTSEIEVQLQATAQAPAAPSGSPIKTALEETAASWIQKIGKAKEEAK